MRRIQNITAVPYQKQTVKIDDGTNVSFTIRFVEQQRGWFISELTWEDFRVNGIRISNNLNILYQWRNLLPFGLMCRTEGGREPSLQEDFSSEAARLWILDRGDLETLRKFYING